MPAFSQRSKERLQTCDPRLQVIFNRIVLYYDCTILEGHRDAVRQDEMFRTGKSKLQWPQSKHNSEPSLAVDVAPYPIDWQDHKRFHFLAGLVWAEAVHLDDVQIRWGGDWDRDFTWKDQRFHDLPHFEILS